MDNELKNEPVAYNLQEIHIKNILNAKMFSYVRKDGENSITIGGKNEQGKSSVLNAIWIAMNMRKASGALPEILNHHASEGEIKLVMDNGLSVIRRFVKTDGDMVTISLKVTKDGKNVTTEPAKFLAEITRDISLDPMNFMNMTKQEQRQTLLEIAGIDVKTDDQMYQQIYDDRRLIGRERDKAKAIVDEFGFIEPTQIISSDEIVQKKIEIVQYNISIERKRRELEDWKKIQILPLEQTVISAKELIEIKEKTIFEIKLDNESIRKQIAELQEKLSKNMEKLETIPIEIEDINKGISEKETSINTLYSEYEETLAVINGLEPKSTEELDAEIAKIDEHNKVAEKYNLFLRKQAEYEELESSYRKESEKLMEIIEKQRKAINESGIFSGLSIDEDKNIRVNGVLLNQCSSSEKIRFAIMLAVKSNPNFKVIRIENASLFDKDNLETLKRIVVEELGYFLIVEVVGDAEIIMENGYMKTNK